VNQAVQLLQPRVLTSQRFRLFSASICRHLQGTMIRLSNWPNSLAIELAEFAGESNAKSAAESIGYATAPPTGEIPANWQNQGAAWRLPSSARFARATLASVGGNEVGSRSSPP
jgi:hypothetical protein